MKWTCDECGQAFTSECRLDIHTCYPDLPLAPWEAQVTHLYYDDICDTVHLSVRRIHRGNLAGLMGRGLSVCTHHFYKAVIGHTLTPPVLPQREGGES